MDGNARRPPQQRWPRRDERAQNSGRPQPPRPPIDDPTRPVAPRRPLRPREPETVPALPPRPREPEPETRPVARTPARPQQSPPGPPPAPPAQPPASGAREAAPVRRTLGRALAVSAASTLAPGAGHLMLGRRRTGGLLLGTFLLGIAAIAAFVLTARTSELLETLLSTRALVVGAAVCLLAALGWIAVIIRTYLLARPRDLDRARQALGILVVTALCMVVAAPLGFAANLANSQRGLLDALFSGGGGTDPAEAIGKARLNILLVGSDAGPDRTGARTDTMMVASIDTQSGRTTLFGLPRNIGYAQFPPNSAMGEKFPDGFHDDADPASGNYLLNAVYAWGLDHPRDAPRSPTPDPGMNLLHQTVSSMLGLKIDYYLEVNMAGFASIIDALGGLRVDVGPEPVPIGGITPTGRSVEPDGYIPAGAQELSGEEALAFARSRTDSTDYARMGRQRCLIQNILSQKSPADLITNFQAVAKATTNSVSTNIPQQILPALMSLAGGGEDGEGSLQLESLSFDPNLPDPGEPDGRFNTGNPDYDYMREVVQDAINRDPTATPAAPRPSSTTPTPEAAQEQDEEATEKTPSTSTTMPPVAGSSVPTSVAASCA